MPKESHNYYTLGTELRKEKADNLQQVRPDLNKYIGHILLKKHLSARKLIDSLKHTFGLDIIEVGKLRLDLRKLERADEFEIPYARLSSEDLEVIKDTLSESTDADDLLSALDQLTIGTREKLRRLKPSPIVIIREIAELAGTQYYSPPDTDKLAQIIEDAGIPYRKMFNKNNGRWLYAVPLSMKIQASEALQASPDAAQYSQESLKKLLEEKPSLIPEETQ